MNTSHGNRKWKFIKLFFVDDIKFVKKVKLMYFMELEQRITYAKVACCFI